MSSGIEKIAIFRPVNVKFVPLIVILCACGSTTRIFLDLLLDCRIKIRHFIAVTSVLQILFALRVVFRVYVYWSGSDTYPVFRTRFSPSLTRIIYGFYANIFRMLQALNPQTNKSDYRKFRNNI